MLKRTLPSVISNWVAASVTASASPYPIDCETTKCVTVMDRELLMTRSETKSSTFRYDCYFLNGVFLWLKIILNYIENYVSLDLSGRFPNRVNGKRPWKWNWNWKFREAIPPSSITRSQKNLRMNSIESTRITHNHKLRCNRRVSLLGWVNQIYPAFQIRSYPTDMTRSEWFLWSLHRNLQASDQWSVAGEGCQRYV